VLTGAGVNMRPSWSPDGKLIAFDSQRGSGVDIYVLSARGGPVRRLTRGDGPNWGPDWSPDGRLIAFARGDLWALTGAIYIMKANGTALRRVPIPVPAVLPDWQPRK
jgi:TolB protein